MSRLKREIALLSPTRTAVLILGQTGTGKELVARSIHQQSDRADRPLIYVNCAAVPETLLESELFGHVKGAFTGATSDRQGKFMLADGGTLFLDEIGDLPLTSQPKLLRVLQEGEIEPVGGDRVQKVDVRVLAATNKDLEREVDLQRFRSDLFHRLAVYPLHVPPLEDHLEDVPLLIDHFIAKHARALGVGETRVESGFLLAVCENPWPGNIRELEHFIERALIHLGSGSFTRLDRDAFRTLRGEPARRGGVPGPGGSPPGRTPAVAGLSFTEATLQFQRDLIRAAIREADGNVSEAARSLGMDRSNFHRKARKILGEELDEWMERGRSAPSAAAPGGGDRNC